MGGVYEAFDRERNAPCAIKTLLELTPLQLQLFKNEFRALQDISHPNLLRLGELLEIDGRYCFTMELVDGVDIATRVRRDLGPCDNVTPHPEADAPLGLDPDAANTVAPRFRAKTRAKGKAQTRATAKARVACNADHLRRLAAQVAEGLLALHNAGMVHRDIKPSNILVDAHDLVTILDFGLIADSTVKKDYEKGQLIGTARFMSPEQSRAEPAGPPSDWYSFGLVLFDALTGRLPFHGSSHDVFAQMCAMDAPAPSTFVEGVPPDLDALCLAVLRADPAKRATGEEVLQRLQRQAGRARTGSGLHFVGRAAELQQLRKAHHAFLSGEPTALLVSGPSGQGKSALVKEFTRGLQAEHGVTVFAGRCFERDSVAYRALDQVLDDLANRLATLSDTDRTALLPHDAWRIGELFPAFAAVAERPEQVNEAAAEDAFAQRQKAFAAIQHVLARFAEAHPTLIVIDDLQWADADSLALLRFLRRGAHAPRIFWLASVRTGPNLLAPDQLAERLGGQTRQIRVGPLGAADALKLAEAIADEADLTASSFDGPAICVQAQGHPLLIDVLVQYQATLRQDAAGVALDDALWWRAEQMPKDAMALLEVLSLHGVPMTQQLAVRITGSSFETFDAMVAQLRASRLVRTSGPRPLDHIEPFHDRIRETVAERVPKARAQTTHLRIATILDAHHRSDAELVAVHLRAGGEATRAARYFLTAAEQAAQGLAFDRAARLYSEALEVLTDKSTRSDAFVALGRVLADDGRGARAADAFLQSLDEGARDDATEVARLAAEQLLQAGHYDRGTDVLKQVLADVGLRMPRTRLGVVLRFLMVRGKIAVRGTRESQRCALSPRGRQQLAVCETIAVGLTMSDVVLGGLYQAETLWLALRSGDPETLSINYAREGVTRASMGGAEGQALDFFARSNALVHATGSRVAAVWYRGAATVAASVRGRVATALALGEETDALLAKLPGQAWGRSTVRTVILYSKWLLGDLADVHTRFDAYFEDAKARGDTFAMANFRLGLVSNIWLSLDAPELARVHQEAAVASCTQSAFHLQHGYELMSRAQIALYEGDLEHAYRETSERWPALRRSLVDQSQFIRGHSVDARGRAALALGATTNDRRLLRRAARDGRALLRLNDPSTRPMGHTILAGVARTHGNTKRALEHYAQASTRFDQVSMPIYQAAAEYRQGELIGGRVGEALMAKSVQELSARGVVAPLKMIAALAP